MPIKFTCPHCQKAINVRDELAGKKGACPGCKKAVTVPQPAATRSAPKTQSDGQAKSASAAPVVPPVDVEAAAAAMFADEPAATAPKNTKTIDLNCPF